MAITLFDNLRKELNHAKELLLSLLTKDGINGMVS